MQGSRENLCVTDPGMHVAPLEAAWETIRANLRRDCGARTFDGWLKPAELGAFDGESGDLEIVMPSQFMADWVQSHFGDRLALAWRTVLPIVTDVRIVAAADPTVPSVVRAGAAEPADHRRIGRSLPRSRRRLGEEHSDR